ncbi:hypothetical protein V5799_008569 [Amblyomma americanum]|uniref:Methyltransferase type 11 domain-containing protein n=1 Tax=Amblyomma americanum TaxID=6943 RepID=A0AAQ4FE16_AMBAM
MAPDITTRLAGDSKAEQTLKTERSSLDLDPVGLVSLSMNLYRESHKALDSAQFRRPAGYQDQYLDIGCGAGNFTAEELLPRLRPCKRVVGVDVCSDMIDYARKHHQQPQVFFEVLDIVEGRSEDIVEKYGLFDRVYAFLSLHFTSDLEKAYRNIYRLLKDGGECLAVSFNRTGITDTWHDVYNMEAWTDLLPVSTVLKAEQCTFACLLCKTNSR